MHNKTVDGVAYNTTVLQGLRDKLPPVFTRKTVCDCMGGMLTPKTLANIDSSGEGPTIRLTFGNRIGYEKENFMEWLQSRLQTTD